MAFVHTQGGTHSLLSGGTSNIITISATTVNNVVVVNFALDAQGISSVSVTDNASAPNTYAQAGSALNFSGTSYSLFQFYGVQVTGGATSITISWAGSHVCMAVADEFSGGKTTNATIFDKSSTLTGSSATSSNVTSFTPTSNGELIVANTGLNVSVSSRAAGANYTLGTNEVTYAQLFSTYRLSSLSAETAPASWAGSSDWGEIAGAYIAAPVVVISPVNFTKAPTIMVMR